MKSLTRSISSVLASNEIRYQEGGSSNTLRFGISAEHGNWQVFISLNEEARKVSFVSICPIHAPRQKHTAIYELLNRINDVIFMGCYSMDPEDGEIKFGVSAAFPETQPADETLNCMLHVNLQTFDKYLPALISVIYGHNEPALAFLEAHPSEI